MPATAKLLSLRVSLIMFCLLTGSAIAADSSPLGRWRVYDRNTNGLRSIVEITIVGDTLEGKIVKNFPPADDPTHGMCSNCEGDRKGKPILGMIVLWGLKRDGDDWSGGTVLAPKTGKEFSADLKMEEGGNKLDIRGYVGSPLFGVTQVWTRDN